MSQAQIKVVLDLEAAFIFLKTSPPLSDQGSFVAVFLDRVLDGEGEQLAPLVGR